MSTQKIALFNPTGEVGRRLVEEALNRGHYVTAVIGNKTELNLKHPNLKVERADTSKKEVISKYARGHDVVICAHEPEKLNPREHVEVTRNMITGIKEAGVHHFVSAAHPFSVRIEGTRESYNALKPLVQAQTEALKLLQKEKDLNWSYLHSIEPTERKTGEFQVSNEVVLSSPIGQNRIPLKNYLATVLDETEKGVMETHHYNEEGLEEL